MRVRYEDRCVSPRAPRTLFNNKSDGPIFAKETHVNSCDVVAAEKDEGGEQGIMLLLSRGMIDGRWQTAAFYAIDTRPEGGRPSVAPQQLRA